jgi:O-antigen/teichoic acid export membrane protein
LQVGAVLILRDNNLITLSGFLLSIQILAAFFAGLLCHFVMPHFWSSWHLSSHLFSLFKAALPIAILTVLTMVYQRLGVTMLSLMTTPTDTGIFSAAARVVEASKTAHIAVFAALYPVMAQDMALPGNSALSTPRSKRRLTIMYLVVGASFISLLLFAFAKPLIALLYGNEYISSINVLQILAWTLIPFTVNTYLTLSFLASKQEQLVGRALTVSLLGMLILNLWWIPARGPEGGAWASLIAECLQSVILLVSAWSFAHISGEAHEFPQLP